MRLKNFDELTGSPWQIRRSILVLSELREQELREHRAAAGQPDALPLSNEALLWRDPEPAEPEDEPGLSRPGLYNIKLI